eukprot:scaffold131418_cov19-Tisochrysis_lutea.AAC.1
MSQQTAPGNHSIRAVLRMKRINETSPQGKGANSSMLHTSFWCHCRRDAPSAQKATQGLCGVHGRHSATRS